MAVTMPSTSPQETQSQILVSLQNGLYVAESILNVNEQHALLWGYQRGFNRHLAIERIVDSPAATTTQAIAHKQAVLNLNHENLARCVDVFAEEAALYVVMVTGEGKPLAQQHTPITPKQAVAIGIQICNALNYLSNHTEFTNHGAIEPTTVFLTDGNRVKLTNIAALLGAVATPAIAAMARDDVFGVGATMHYALTGWNGNYHAETPPFDALCERIPAELCQVLKRALSPNPADRWANSAELRYALLRI